MRYFIPILVCIAVHWLAMHTWFYLDDFAWLGLRLQVHSAADLLDVLFRPAAQGTVRVLPERLFFLVFSALFGLNAYAFKAWIFLTQFANIALLVQIGQRISGSRLAGILAGSLWTANAGLAIALGWTSAYNEVAFAFCTLLAFRLLLLAMDTGRRRYWVAQWIVFLLSFGVLELTVTYPALAVAYALCCARAALGKTLWLFLPAIAYSAAHLTLIPRSSDPAYAMHLDAGLVATFLRYWSFATGAVRPAPVDWRPLWLGWTVALAVTAGIAAFVVRTRDRRALFLLAWFAIVLAPVVPLKHHFTEYYVTVPAAGLAILGGWAVARAKVAGAVIAAAYLLVSVTDIRTAAGFYHDFSHKLRRLVMAVSALSPEDRARTVLLDGVDNQMFWLGLSGDPLKLVGVRRFLLMPGSESAIDPHPEWGGIANYTTTEADAKRMLERGQAVVVHTDGRIEKPAATATHIEVAHPDNHHALGEGWYEAESGFRWVGQKAVLRIPPGNTVEIEGYSPRAILKSGPIELTVRAGGRLLGASQISQPDRSFRFAFPLNTANAAQLQLELSRTTQVPGDPRKLGVIIRSVTVF